MHTTQDKNVLSICTYLSMYIAQNPYVKYIFTLHCSSSFV